MENVCEKVDKDVDLENEEEDERKMVFSTYRGKVSQKFEQLLIRIKEP